MRSDTKDGSTAVAAVVVVVVAVVVVVVAPLIGRLGDEDLWDFPCLSVLDEELLMGLDGGCVTGCTHPPTMSFRFSVLLRLLPL